MLVLLVAVVTGAWADGIVCTASDLGKVLCTDGSIYENVSAAETAGKTAAAVIVYVDETNKNGLAIALADESSYMNWSTAKSTCEGKTAITGAKWCLPSQDQWKQMFKANGGNEGSYTGLNTTITTAGGTALEGDASYWSSSEYDPGVRAYLVNLSDGNVSWYYDHEGLGRQFRACLAFAPSYAVTLAEGTEDAENWTIPAEAAEGATVTATYSGTRKVKSVTAKKKAAASLIVNPVVGQIIGSDGKNYDANATLPSGVTAVAMIAYVGSDNGEAAPYNNGLALALSDASTGCMWSTSNTKIHTYNREDENFASESGLQYNDATLNSDTYPAFKAAINYNGAVAPTGCSAWFLASGYQWKKMIAAGLSNLGLEEYTAYWSSTEYGNWSAWNFSTYFSTWGSQDKDYVDCKVRACLAF